LIYSFSAIFPPGGNFFYRGAPLFGTKVSPSNYFTCKLFSTTVAVTVYAEHLLQACDYETGTLKQINAKPREV